MKIKTIIIGLVTICSSCKVNMPISYKVKDIQSNQDQKLSKIILDIEDFNDKRKDNADNGILFANENMCKLDGQKFCINSEKYYRKEPVSQQITSLLVDHLKQRNSFKAVVKSKKDTADYYITGNLTKLYGKQAFSNAALVGSQFGLIGAVATSGTKTKGKIMFEITDLKIYNKKNQVIKELGTYKKEYDEDFPVDGYCWCMYANVNAKLKDYFSEFISTLETEIKNIE